MNAPLKQAKSVEAPSQGALGTVAAKRAQSPRETVLAIIGRDPESSDHEEFGQDEELLQQGALGAPSFGDNPHISNGDYLPSGVMLATILKALRDAGDNQLEIQQQQAAAEQLFDRELGGLNGDITKGIIAMAAQSVVNAGNDEADGLRAQGVANAVNASISGATTLGTLGVGAYNSIKESGVSDEIDQAKDFGKQLDGNKQADLVIADDKMPTDEDLNQLVDNHGLNADGKPDHDAIEAIKTNPEKLKSAKAKNDDKVEDLQKKQKEYSDSTNRWTQTNQSLTTVVGAATGAAGNIQQSKAKAAAAADNAAAQVQKQTQDMNYSAANTFKDNAKTAAQQALQTADIMAQVAQSQVQVRG